MLGFRSFALVEAIARGGSLSRAADFLGMTQPALTKALSALEAETGAKLFNRRAVGMEPTPFAHIFMRHWARISTELVEMRSEINLIRNVDHGVLRVATGYLAASSAEIALGSICQNFPSVRIEAKQAAWSEVAAAVRRGDVDIGVADPADAETDPLLHVEMLSERQAYFICRRGHPLLLMPDPRLADILAFPVALNGIPERLVRHFPDNAEDFGFRRVGPGHLLPQVVVQSVAAISNILASSNAVSIMPSGGFEHFFPSNRFAILEAFSPSWLTVRLGFITRVQTAPTPVMLEFMEVVRRIELRKMQGLAVRQNPSPDA